MTVKLAFVVPGLSSCLRPRAHPVVPIGCVQSLKLESVRSHPREEWLQLTPAGSYNAETLYDHFHYCHFAHVKRRIVRFCALFHVCELDDGRGDNTSGRAQLA